MGIVTLDMSINFIGPGAGRLHVRGHATGGGSSVCFCEGEITDDAGKLVAKAIGSFKYRRRKPGGKVVPITEGESAVLAAGGVDAVNDVGTASAPAGAQGLKYIV